MPKCSPDHFASGTGKHDTGIIKKEVLSVSQPSGIMFEASGACLTCQRYELKSDGKQTVMKSACFHQTVTRMALIHSILHVQSTLNVFL